MRSTRDPDLLIKAFLDEGIDELPDRSFDAVRTAIDQKRQWAVLGPWKEPQIMNATRLAIAAAAIVVVAVLAIKFLPTNGVGPATTPTPTPTRSPIGITTDDQISAAGTYVTDSPFLARVTFTLPAGWEAQVGGPYAVFLDQPNGPALSFMFLDTVYADPCHYDKGPLNPPPGSSVDDLVTALKSLPSVTSAAAPDVIVGSYAAKQLTLTAPTSFAGCTLAPGGGMRVWELPLGGIRDMAAGQTRRYWILDVNNQRLVIEGTERPGSEAADQAAVQSIVDSMTVAPAD